MHITRIERFSEDELIDRLRRVSLFTDKGVYPYKDAFISLERLSTGCLMPPQYYVCSEILKEVRELKWALQAEGIDIFNLDGYVKMWIEGEDTPIDLLPIIVEESIERDGSVVNIVNDGMHRCYVARLDWAIPQVVFVRGVPKGLPYYAYPIPGGWDKVAIVDNLSEDFLKKWHRIKNYKSLYRNFNSAFDNVGKPRGSDCSAGKKK
ncbi:MAG: hypothetical protein HQL04_00625 [Nitrospirae bacterium]|nr:hypothetical protein [Nitrospirota bacterium]